MPIDPRHVPRPAVFAHPCLVAPRQSQEEADPLVDSWQVAQTDHPREGFIAMDLDVKRGIVVAGSDYGTVYALQPASPSEKEAEAELSEPGPSSSFLGIACAREEVAQPTRLELKRIQVPLYEARATLQL